MASLVADYGTSSSSSEQNDSSNSSESESCDSDVNENPDENKSDGSPLTKLPKPNFGENATTPQTSIFSNPFKDEENAEKAILEKHVKMVNSHTNAKVLNGKKICWNYRKGRCRFGTKCTFAHDSDLQKTDSEINEEMKLQQTVIYENQPLQQSVGGVVAQSTIFSDEPPKKKKRPGLAAGLVPGKKVIKNYKKMQMKST